MKQIFHDCVAQSPDTMKSDGQHPSIWPQSEKQCFYTGKKRITKLNKLFIFKRKRDGVNHDKLTSQTQIIHEDDLQLASLPKCVPFICNKHNLSQNGAEGHRRLKRDNDPSCLINVRLRSCVQWSKLQRVLLQKEYFCNPMSKECKH